MFSLIQMLGRAAPILDIVDVGAMWLGADRVAYRGLLKDGRARVIGFEPVRSECDRLNAMKLPGHTYLPHFIGDGSERTFVLNNESVTSGLYEPNLPLVRPFNHLAEFMQPVSRTKVKTTRLDDIAEIIGIDFLKVDVQGAEVEVFNGAARHLGNTLVIQVEANFVPLYVDCPLFGDIDAALRRHGFLFHTFAEIAGRAFKPITLDNDPTKPVRQYLWADGVWVRDFRRFASLSPDQLVKIAVIMHEVYRSGDLAGYALAHHERKTKGGLWRAYMTRLTGAKEIPFPDLDWSPLAHESGG